MHNLEKENCNKSYGKIELRIKDLHFFRKLLLSLKNFEDFTLQKLRFGQFLIEIEIHLKEILENEMLRNIQIRELKNQIELYNEKFYILENKLRSDEIHNGELKKKLKECLEIIKCLDNLKLNNENKISDLENKVRDLEQESLVKKEDQIENISILEKKLNEIKIESSKDINLDRINSQKFNIEMIENEDIINKSQILKDITKLFNYNDQNTNKSFSYFNKTKNNSITEESIDYLKNNKIKDKNIFYHYNEIISQRENYKKMIDKYIKDSLCLNYNINNNDFLFNNNENIQIDEKIEKIDIHKDDLNHKIMNKFLKYNAIEENKIKTNFILSGKNPDFIYHKKDVKNDVDKEITSNKNEIYLKNNRKDFISHQKVDINSDQKNEIPFQSEINILNSEKIDNLIKSEGISKKNFNLCYINEHENVDFREEIILGKMRLIWKKKLLVIGISNH